MPHLKQSCLIFFVGLFLFGWTFNALAQTRAKANTPKDPLEVYNRLIFKINEKLDDYVLRPTAEFYNKAMPAPINRGIDHVLSNIEESPRIINDVLQANFYQATNDSWRLMVNSTAGIGGFFDTASHMGLLANKNKFGITFARWGWKNSSYFVLPVFGPKTIRDSIGLGLDYFSLPTSYLSDVQLRNSLLGVGIIDKRAQLLQFQDIYNQAALDPYVFVRNAYYQRMNYLINKDKELSDPYTVEDTHNQDEDYYINE